jgi:hypothetical protein
LYEIIEEFIVREEENDFMENRFDDFIQYHEKNLDYSDKIHNYNANVFIYPFVLLHYFSKLYFTVVKNKYSNINLEEDLHSSIGLVLPQMDDKLS